MWFAARLASEYILAFSSLISFSSSFRNSIQLLYITSTLVILFGFRPGFRITEYQPCGKSWPLYAIHSTIPMIVNFEIYEHHALKQSGRHIDIHNNFDLADLNYQCHNREMTLRFIKTQGDWVDAKKYKSLSLVHTNVDFLIVNYDNKERKFLNDDKTVSDITFFPSSDRQFNDKVTLQTSPNETNDIIYMFQSDFFVRVGCDKIELLLTD
jgi:hypothetical protein